jgi:amidase
MGFGFLDHGSDLVGSIRIPASFCGVFGLRPSVGVVPLTGLTMPGREREESDLVYLSTLGPLARSAGDLRAALRATAGPEGPERRAYAWSLPAARHARLPDYRVRVVLDDPQASPTTAVAAVMAQAIDAIAASGATLAEGWPDGVDPQRSYAAFGYELGKFFAFQEPDAGPAPWREIVARERERMALRAAWARCFDDADVFLCPVNFTAAFATVKATCSGSASRFAAEPTSRGRAGGEVGRPGLVGSRFVHPPAAAKASASHPGPPR